MPVVASSNEDRFQHGGSRCDERSARETRNGLPLMVVSIGVGISSSGLALHAIVLYVLHSAVRHACCDTPDPEFQLLPDTENLDRVSGAVIGPGVL